MDSTFVFSENSKTLDPHRLLLNLSDKLNLKRSDNYVVLSNLTIEIFPSYYTWKNIKKSFKNNKLDISGSTLSEKFKLLDGSYSVSNIQDFEYNIKNVQQ